MEWSNQLNNKKEFKNEKEYQLFIEKNIKSLCEEVLDLGEYINHESNKSIRVQNFGGTKERVDIILTGSKGKALIELKYPKNEFAELRNSIGQCLNYIVTAKVNNVHFDKMILISPVYDQRIFDIINEFKLPIELYYLTKKYHSKINVLCRTKV